MSHLAIDDIQLRRVQYIAVSANAPRTEEWVQVLMTECANAVELPEHRQYQLLFACRQNDGNWRRLVPKNGARLVDAAALRIDYWREPAS